MSEALNLGSILLMRAKGRVRKVSKKIARNVLQRAQLRAGLGLKPIEGRRIDKITIRRVLEKADTDEAKAALRQGGEVLDSQIPVRLRLRDRAFGLTEGTARQILLKQELRETLGLKPIKYISSRWVMQPKLSPKQISGWYRSGKLQWQVALASVLKTAETDEATEALNDLKAAHEKKERFRSLKFVDLGQSVTVCLGSKGGNRKAVLGLRTNPIVLEILEDAGLEPMSYYMEGNYVMVRDYSATEAVVKAIREATGLNISLVDSDVAELFVLYGKEYLSSGVIRSLYVKSDPENPYVSVVKVEGGRIFNSAGANGSFTKCGVMFWEEVSPAQY